MAAIRFFGEPPPVDHAVALSGRNKVWRIPEEAPAAILFNGRNYAVMLATPANLADFAVGFSLTERIIDHVSEVEAIDIHQEARGADIRVTISDAALERFDVRQRRRNLVGRAGCGVCGLENAETFFESLPEVADAPVAIPEAVLARAMEALSAHQPLNARTRTVHAAAFADKEGDIRLAREDVGRHNALDKLIGAMALEGRAPQEGFVVMSSRCSYEIVEKAARFGVKAVLAISAPTAFAVRKAMEANLALYAREQGGFVSFQ